MPMLDEKQFKEITSKMDLIVRLLALNIVKDLKVQKDKIITLSSFGFGPSEIAKLLGTTPNTVSVALSGIKKKTKKEEQATKTAQDESKPTEEHEIQKSGE
jgi:DNA-directed RNA polymerase specialized sigma24 family protein